jgi:hypothetical protein
VEQIGVLTVADFARYSEAYRAVFDVVHGSHYAYFLVSQDLLRSAILAANEAADAGRIRHDSDPDSYLVWIRNMRSAALSLCSSLVYHQELMLQKTSVMFGKGSAEFASVKAIFSALYDDHAGYRFLCRLRNIMAHDSMDAVSVRAKQSLVGGTRLVTNFEVGIERARVARCKQIGPVRDEIVELSGNPDLLELADQITEPVAVANRQIEAILYTDLAAAYETVVEFDEIFGGREGVRALVNSVDDAVKVQFPTYSPWSQQVIDYARSQSQN